LMVWKIFAPRFMAAAVGMVVVDAAVVLSITVGMNHVRDRVGRIFKVVADGNTNK
jgi:phosphatidylinositol glycan class O